MVFKNTVHRLALAATLALMAAGLSGCGCGEDGNSLDSSVQQTLQDHPCGGLDPLKTPQLSDDGKQLFVNGAFPTGSTHFYDVLDSSGNVVLKGTTPAVQPEQNHFITINLTNPLPPGTYTVKVVNSTPGSCDSEPEGTSGPFTIK